jgi:hypothetical protein
MTENEQAQAFWRTWSRLVARSWVDAEFKKRLVSEPAAVLAEHGFPVPEETTVRIIEHDSNEAILPLPSRPPEELSDDDLDKVAGGGRGLDGGGQEVQLDVGMWWAQPTLGA